ncbi:hypothetical protein QRX60_41730 [Amycolatopsis mongoliensis]|uniref:V-type ATPase subunit n=1 Tax=Amycolatopsis mongoliensis TaxID=715475 RepID=A0A9Y2JL45_9PSEU|nr:hypothetical protein [Amycolatopsis sp. 4-36]WIY00515.1 hypothetical protein QRX60_41730 [Amycolatopsis sp. 4-36]
MSVAWTASGVRARALLNRRVGAVGARALSTRATLADALATLEAGPYQREVRAGQSLEEAEHGVSATVLWHLRVLAGWLPRAGAEAMRLLAGWFEVANVLELLRSLHGAEAGPAYRLGTLATAWPRLSTAASAEQLRSLLAASPWGDPGTDTPWGTATAIRLGWATRLAAGIPQTRPWAAGGVALVVARDRYVLSRPVPEPAARRARAAFGVDADTRIPFTAFAHALPNDARWALEDVERPEDLWRAEERWWARVERDALAALRRPRYGLAPAVGCVVLLAIDARRVRAALELAARGGRPEEAFDALA